MSKKRLTKKQRKAAVTSSREERIRKDMDILDNYAKKYAIKNCELLFIDSGEIAVSDEVQLNNIGIELAKKINAETAHLTVFKRRKILSMMANILDLVMDEMDEERCLSQTERVHFISALQASIR